MMTDYYISASIDFGKSMTFVNFYWMEIVPTDIVVVIPRMLRSVRSQLDDCKMEKMISTTQSNVITISLFSTLCE